VNGDGGSNGAGKNPSHDLGGLVAGVLESYRSDSRAHHIGKRFLPSRDEIVEIIELFLQLFYPGYYGRQGLTQENIEYHVGELIMALRDKLDRQIEQCLCHAAECGLIYEPCTDTAKQMSREILSRIPKLRSLIIDDVQAAFDGDPAATNLHEVILAYPGLLAVTVYRVAHELHIIGVPLLPRIMTEWAHSRTGADIHPGAWVGKSFFIDHATGVVVGETTRIGAHVKLYQGVTLGAISHPRDADGRVIRNTKRHPTVDDSVTVYANATVLGGDTVLGEASTVGGSVFLTRSIPPGSRVAMKPPELSVRTHGEPRPSEPGDALVPDFEI
jgi:serine O-acetyltransferase